MSTTHEVLTRHDVSTDLVADLEVPVCTGMQRQGDVFVLPTRAGKERGDIVGHSGVAVVRGEAGGNTHLLVAVEGEVRWRQVQGRRMTDLGVVTVPQGSIAGLLHPEHGLLSIGPGSYTLRRQRQQEDEIRLVAD